MYGLNTYGTFSYAAENGQQPEDTYYKDLFPLVPAFVSEKKEMQQLYETQGYELGYLERVLDDVIAQCFISTATWGMTRWESIFDVETNMELTYEQRREMVTAKIRGQGTTTKQMIKETAEAFSGGDVDVIEDYAHSSFVVRFVGIKGIPRNMQGFISTLEKIKPAHLAYRFEYRYTVWDWLEPIYTWEDLQEMSWDSLRILKED